MKIKVGNKIYNGEEEPIMVILTDGDKRNIANMLPDSNKYCEYPYDKFSEEQIMEWMQETKEN